VDESFDSRPILADGYSGSWGFRRHRSVGRFRWGTTTRANAVFVQFPRPLPVSKTLSKSRVNGLRMNAPLIPPLYTADRRQHLTTEWQDRSFCCCKIAFFPVGRLWILGHWVVSLRVPIVVTLAFIFTHLVFIYDVYRDVFPNSLWLYIALAITTYIWLCLCVSYYLLICRGPGYVPYNWASDPRAPYDWNAAMTNIVVFSEQADQARGSARPPRASFSINARRFVLRADHFCLWAQSWVGLKNHRFFLLMTFYAILYMVCYVGFRVFWVLHIIKKWNWLYVIGTACSLFVIIAGGIAVWHFCIAARNVIWNVTNIELFKGRSSDEEVNYDRGWVSNCEEICGPRWLMPCWLIPCCACFQPAEDGMYERGHAKEFSDHGAHKSDFSVGTLKSDKGDG
jgi:hypothetical protein